MQRSANFVRYLPNSGWLPHVVTCKDYVDVRDDSLLKKIPQTVEVTRVFSLEPQFLTNLVKRKNPKGRVPLIIRLLLKIYSVFYYRMAIMDWYLGWIPFGFIAGLSIIRRKRIRLLYVHSPPPSSLIIGILLKKAARLPLVIDYSDPWSCTPTHFRPKNKIVHKLNQLLERWILESADRVVYCKESIRKDIIRCFPDFRSEDFRLISHGFDPDHFVLPTGKTIRGPLRIVYTGKLTTKFCYSPESFFLGLKGLFDEKKLARDAITIEIVGTVTQEYLSMVKKLGLIDVISLTGFLSHRECIRKLQEADALLFIIESPEGPEASAKFAGAIPSKIFEYISTGKFILAIVPTPSIEREILENAGLGFFASPNDPKSVGDVLLNLYHTVVTNENRPEPSWEFIRSFDRQKLTGQLAEVFDSLAEKELRNN